MKKNVVSFLLHFFNNKLGSRSYINIQFKIFKKNKLFYKLIL